MKTGDITPKVLSTKIRDYILKQDEVTLNTLLERNNGRFDTYTMLKAMALVNKMREIQCSARGNEVVYKKRVEKALPTISQKEIEQRETNNTYFARLNAEYEAQCASLTPEQSAYVDSIFDGVGEFIEVGNSFVPKSNEEYYKKVLCKRPRSRK